MVQERSNVGKNLINISTIIGVTIIVVYIIYCINQGVFQSKDAFSNYIIRIGIWGPIIFILIQAIQVVLPITPGAFGCVVGVIAFGPLYGFIYNYIGIVIGSIVAFLLSKYYGLKLVKSIVKPKIFNKYISWVEKGKKFEKLFALAIFMPVAPDDYLCFLAGTTSMTLRKFITIIILGKPCSIFLYSLGLTGVISLIS
ncbi:TVP38/TMEM64 family protein [Clostridium sp. SHJSY1]|uniref:TVP38/TMEM64 family protein n=1 Tax=Clostridium sp. SHJSY1 TaxID=2942483 RepID=UPI0028745D41|nr:TVP38/TMEM64 family protein [Clostridium sp. SHJSY1]MDS0526123.1 TVP38/TMEM64 family protein [Clostridium sp. SHJSY1]